MGLRLLVGDLDSRAAKRNHPKKKIPKTSVVVKHFLSNEFLGDQRQLIESRRQAQKKERLNLQPLGAWAR
jgi:hypothetical protein